MPNATLKDFEELAWEVNLGNHPIMPRPEWGQDAAYVAFVIDGLRAELNRLRATMSTSEATRYEMLEQAIHQIDQYKVLIGALAPQGSPTAEWGLNNLGEPYKTMLRDIIE